MVGVGVAVGVVSERGEHSGAQDSPEPGLAQVGLNVPVLAKTLLHRLFEHPLVWRTSSAVTATSAATAAA